jgi:hypothetical protein
MDSVQKNLHSKKIGPYITQAQLRPKRRKGHFDVTLLLKNDDGKLSCMPLIDGIYSKGNVSQNIQGWLDIHYSDRADFGGRNPVVLSQIGRCAEYVFEMIGETIKPGGMIFVSLISDIVWEIESRLHEVTRHSLSIRSLGIPPAATPLGRLLFISGCPNIKSQAFDVQGSSRLAGEKALNPDMDRQFSQKLQTRLQEFLGRREQKGENEYHRICRSNAEDVLGRMKQTCR